MYTNKSFLTKKEMPAMDLPDCPIDTISDICFNLENTHLAVSSWDGTVKLYKLPFYGSPGTNFTIEKSYTLGKPVLSCCFFNTMLLAGLVDGTVVAVESNQPIKAHEKAVKSIKNFNNQFIVTGSFDATLKFWDLKSTVPIHTIPLPGKVYAMDLRDSFLAVALDDKTVITYDMNNPNQPMVFQTKLAYSIRSIGCNKDLDSFGIGGVESKVELFSRTVLAKRILVRAHRVESKLFAVNTVRFLPNDSNIVVTGGADGSLIWFDRVNRSKLFTAEFAAPVTASEFSNDGKYFVFAVGDDWSKGYTGLPTKVLLKMALVNQIPGVMK